MSNPKKNFCQQIGEPKEIVRLQSAPVSEALYKDIINPITHDSAINLIAEKSFDPKFGARPLKRTIQRSILNELSKRISNGSIHKSKAIINTAEGGDLKFINQK